VIVVGKPAFLDFEFNRSGRWEGLSEEAREELVSVIVAYGDSLLVPFFAGGNSIPA
jgi:hypothetical protein